MYKLNNILKEVGKYTDDADLYLTDRYLYNVQATNVLRYIFGDSVRAVYTHYSSDTKVNTVESSLCTDEEIIIRMAHNKWVRLSGYGSEQLSIQCIDVRVL